MSPWQFLRPDIAPIDSVRPTLWNAEVNESSYTGDQTGFRTAILEQYKLYVEMADRVSARRNVANAFFLTFNTAIFAGIGALLEDKIQVHSWLLILPTLALVLECGSWLFLLRSYRQLNSAKFVVIGVLEERLPASPYWRAEWRALGEGRNRGSYWPMSYLEQWIPALFGVAYLAAFLVAAVT